MIELNGKQYKACLFDTNIISNAVKNKNGELSQFVNLLIARDFVPCVSVFTILEIRRQDALYKKFLETFSSMPFIFIKSDQQLFIEEIENYHNNSQVSPYLLTYLGPLAPSDETLKDLLANLFNNPEILEHEKIWNDGQQSIIDGILKLKENYPPKGSKYTNKEIKEFVMYAVLSQVWLFDRSFTKQLIQNKQFIDTDRFLSRKMIIYSVFYKFYVDNRKPLLSDAFDLIITSPTPYLDAIVTENHQAEAIKKIKRRDIFLSHVDVLTHRDLRKY